MLSEHATSLATAYWADHFGCPEGELFSRPLRLVLHGAGLDGYRGVFALFRGNAAIASLPPDREQELREALSSLSDSCSSASLVAALCSVSSAVIGPAYIGYAESVAPPAHPARALGPDDAPALAFLKQACDPTGWEHGGSSLAEPCSGVFADGRLVALAGYEIWGGTIAHISIVTHPGFRGRAFGSSAVVHVAARALTAGLLPQYRTLESNGPSIRIAESSGFHPFATSTAVRLPVKA